MSMQEARGRFTAINAIVDGMHNGYLRLLNRQLAEITLEHHRITGTTGYTSNNHGYSSNPLRVFTLQFAPFGMTLAPLPRALEPAHSEWMRCHDQFMGEAQRVSQQLKSLLGKTKDTQELRDILPDVAYQVFPQEHPLRQLTRTQPDLYSCWLEGTNGPWDPKMVSAYGGISSLVDTFFGYSLL